MQRQLASLFSFPKQLRLLCSADYKKVFQARRVLKTRFFKVYYRVNHHDSPRLGIIAPKKVCKLANDRNQIKRIIRESFRCHRATLHAFDIVIVLEKKLFDTQNQPLFEDLATLWGTLATSA